MRRAAATLIVLATLAGPACAESPDGEILQTLDQVMMERSAAARCAGADRAKADAFRKYFDTITAKAQQALKSLASELDRNRIDKVMTQHYDEIDRHVAALVAQESCQGSHIKEALQKYDSTADAVMSQQAQEKSD